MDGSSLSCCDWGRDTSDTSRGCLDDTRLSSSVSVNTHNSLFTDTDEPDEEEPKSCCAVADPNSSFFEQVAEQLVESFCYPGSSDSHSSSGNLMLMDFYDFYDLLGCLSPPDSDEITNIWDAVMTYYYKMNTASLESPPPRPKRKSLEDRGRTIHRLLSERALPRKLTGALSPTSVRTLDLDDPPHFQRSRSLDEPQDKLLERAIGFGLDAILPTTEEEDGYDSDIGDWLNAAPSAPVSPSTTYERTVHPPCDEQAAREMVSESLNLSWNLTWHAITGSDQQQQCCSFWLERGTLIHNNSVILEPCLMWRRAYTEYNRSARGAKNISLTKPHSIRLLNLCRIIVTFDRSLCPMARPSRSFLIRTANGDYIFEAASTEERDEIVCRWKLVVARFATLAVMEDMETISKEFFCPIGDVGGQNDV
jgi:hypothetical protein